MPKINVLPKEVAELIAAGEVVERPASVVKELVENAIDAGAHHITVEIQHGGIVFLRIADDGCGIAPADVPLAFLRHATSKIADAGDLDAIATLGFRGEALAATCAVARVELFTKTAQEAFGTHYRIEGGAETLNEETGCPDGTTIIVRDLFYNTPARMKFLKKDVSEANAVAAVLDRVALSHPEIAFKLIRDGKQTLATSGDGKTDSAVYSVLGRDFARSLIPVSGENGGVGVTGLICKPVFCRSSRAWQFVFLNGRFVRSGTVTAAAEQAYKNSAMVGKFPGFILFLSVPYGAVDVNVHPAKTEVRFSDEHRIFDAVLYAVRSALAAGDTRPEIVLNAKKKMPAPFAEMSAAEYRQQALSPQTEKTAAEQVYGRQLSPAAGNRPAESPGAGRMKNDGTPLFLRPEYQQAAAEKAAAEYRTPMDVSVVREADEPVTGQQLGAEKAPAQPAAASGRTDGTAPAGETPAAETAAEPLRLIGEAFRTYIIVETGNSVFLIDKHAAHERILFEELKKSETPHSQMLLAPLRVTLGKEEYDAVLSGIELMNRAGFEIEDFGSGTVLVRAVPASLSGGDVAAAVSEAAAGLCERGIVASERLDRLYHTVACKAAIKAGYRTGDAELLSLAERVLSDNDIRYCPHGRPVAYELKRRELEKQFGRIQ